MLSVNARSILAVVAAKGTIDGPDIEEMTGLSEIVIKAAAVELRDAKFITTNGAPNGNADDGMDIDRLIVTMAGRLEAWR